jgi:hypothetical protein
VLKPLNATTYNVQSPRANSIGVAAGWSAFCVLVTAGFISPTPDPGSDFATMAGASLALRRRNGWVEEQQYVPAERPSPPTIRMGAESAEAWEAVTLRERDRLRSVAREGGAEA